MERMRILITGATSGIGRATALHLARRGHGVFATGRREPLLASLAAEASGLALEGFPLDVTSAPSIESAVREIDARTAGRGVDAIVHCAGYCEAGALEELPDERLRRQFDTNFFGMIAVTRAFLPGMRKRGSGRIVNVSSVLGKYSPPLQGAYNAAKHAVEAASDALRVELAGSGIRVVVIEPGLFRTEIVDGYSSSLRESTGPDSPYREAVARSIRLAEVFGPRAPAPERLVRTMARAVEAIRPRARYMVPFRSRLGIFIVHHTPTALVDWITRKVLGLSGR
jgi:NAD(P)-dependent dehydrogenase (short-subunit alcohol dehydrogenase family)